MQFELEDATFAGYTSKLEERGGVIEERIQGTEFTSPSVQLRATPLGDVELLSTHDQLLGGKSGQSYLGCVFPANRGVRARDHARGRQDRQAARPRRRDRVASPSTSSR